MPPDPEPYATHTDPARTLTDAIRGEVRFDRHARQLYATDASIYQVEPLGVVIPESCEDAVRAIGACRDMGLAVLPRGGGTSLAGQCVNRAVVIDMSARCNRLLAFDSAARRCRVEPGMTIDDLNDAIAPSGLFFAPDPSTARQANIGGCIGNNAAGAHSVLYGRTSDSVVGVDVCLADGRTARLEPGAAMHDPVAAELTQGIVEIVRTNAALIRERFPKTLRRSAGYQLDVILAQLDASGGDLGGINLAPLMCGSEGTLALTLGAELLLHPIPKAKGLAVIAFATLDEAIAAVLPMLELEPAAVELLDDVIVGLARKNTVQRRYVELLPTPPGGEPAAVLYVEFFAQSAGEIGEKLARVAGMFPHGSVETHTDPQKMAGAWALRKAGEPLLHGIPGHRKPLGFVEDNAVPPERLSEFVRRFREIVTAEGTIASFYAHASVGVLHVRPLLDLRDPNDEAAMHRIAERVAGLAKSMGGVMSGEHGDGRARGPLVDDYFGPELMDAFRRVKAVFDPGGRMNPGNIVEPGAIESISANVRVRPTIDSKPIDVGIPDVDTYYDYRDQTDFAHAVEMCNGAGVCRKKTGGVMCPSYMATLDERHSTRGRGNALRLAISGQTNLRPGTPAWGDPDVGETLDLCLSCKACKSECPSNVDVARLKAEYTAQSHQAAGKVPLKARVFGHVHALNRWGCRTPFVANWFNESGLGKSLARRFLGIDPRRGVPRFTKPLRKRWDRAPKGELPADAPRVVMLVDTFTDHNEPEIGLAAKAVLEAFGYRVEPYWGTDFGRALMSTGLLADAIRDADRHLGRLGPLLDDETIAGFVMIEPSCLSAVTDDWVSLTCETALETRVALAGRVRMVEQFLDERWDEHPRQPMFGGVPGNVLLHGHCHQKALWGVDSSAAVLRRVFGEDRICALDTSCCGMAGSFGYAAHRYELSMAIGELGLFPMVREMGEDDVVVAPGTSCRHQIGEGVAVGALHPVELLAEMLEA